MGRRGSEPLQAIAKNGIKQRIVKPFQKLHRIAKSGNFSHYKRIQNRNGFKMLNHCQTGNKPLLKANSIRWNVKKDQFFSFQKRGIL